MYNPLEQFQVHIIKFIFFSKNYLLITNSVIYMLLIIIFLVILFNLICMNALLVPYHWQSTGEMFYGISIDLIKQQIGLKAEKFFPFIFIIFSFILISNFIGLTPYSFTVTGQFLITASLAFSIFIGIIIIGFLLHRLHFFTLFVPTGISKYLLPFLIFIEVTSYLIRPFSLSIRLFANMLAGHTLLHILAAFVFFIGKHNYLFMFLPFLFLFAITLLEFGIAFIQAYVFAILVCIYLNDSINLH